MDHQSIAQLLGNYGEFIGSIAVVATLFYFARQMRGMQLAQYYGLLESTVDGEMALDRMCIENAELIVKGNSGENLSEAEQLKIRGVYHAVQTFHFHGWAREQRQGNIDIRAVNFAGYLVRNSIFLEIFRSMEWNSPLLSRPLLTKFGARVETYLSDPAIVEYLRKR